MGQARTKSVNREDTPHVADVHLSLPTIPQKKA